MDRVGERSSGKNQYTKSGDTKDLVSADDVPSAKRTAKIISVSDVQVTKMRTILNYCDDDDIEAVENNEMSIDAAWKIAKVIKKKIDDNAKHSHTCFKARNTSNP